MPTLTRRDIIKATAAGYGSVVISTSLLGCSSDTRAPQPLPYRVQFLHGVASGDPQQDRVILWTRVTPADPVSSVVLLLELASDSEFTEDVQRIRVEAFIIGR